MSALTRAQPSPIHRPALTWTLVGGVHAGGGTAPEAAGGPANDLPQLEQNGWSALIWEPQRSQNMNMLRIQGYMIRTAPQPHSAMRRRLPVIRCPPVSGADLDALGLRRTHIDRDLMETGLQLVVGVVAQQVLAVQLLADALDGVLQPVVPVKAELRAPGSVGEDLHRVAFEDGLGVSIDF